jgi:hypothetical protein
METLLITLKVILLVPHASLNKKHLLSHVLDLPPPIQMNINDLVEVIFKNPSLEFVPLVVARCGRLWKPLSDVA